MRSERYPGNDHNNRVWNGPTAGISRDYAAFNLIRDYHDDNYNESKWRRSPEEVDHHLLTSIMKPACRLRQICKPGP
jgi:hypothetical protein